MWPCPMETNLPPYGFGQRALGLHPPALGHPFLELCSKHPRCFSSERRTFGLPIIDGGLSEVQHLLQMLPRQKKTTQCSHPL